MSNSPIVYNHPEIILRRRHYGGMTIKHLDGARGLNNIKIIRKPPEEFNYNQRIYTQHLQKTQKNFQDITKGEDLEKTKEVPKITKYTKTITRDMKGTDVVEVEANRANLSVTYTDKKGNVVIKQGGNKAWRTNNPGNLSFSSLEKAREAGAIGVWEDKEGHKFGIFPSEEAGERALREKLKERRFSYRKDGSKRDIAHMIEEIYAPSSDNNDSRGYANFLRDRYGLDVYHKSVEDLNNDELDRLIQGIAAREGNKSGSLIAKTK